MQIGGMFPLEPALSASNGYFESNCPPDGEVAFFMSGRCGIYHCLEDIVQHDSKKVAYLPLYTCETVVAPFVKAGYQLRFYEVDCNLLCIFDESVLEEISVLSLCGYYGFSSYDHTFVALCKRRGIVIIEDVTHSLLSADGIDPLCDYVAGSFRKWMGVTCGGFAIKCSGLFAAEPKPVDATHLELREQAIAKKNYDYFWQAEMLLRQMFDSHGSDHESEHRLRHADLDRIRAARRANFQTILEGLQIPLDGIEPVFRVLPDGTVPSHFCVYAHNREALSAHLKQREIGSVVYWPVGPEIDLTGHPEVDYIYQHILSIPCDQRYTAQDMARVACALAEFHA